LYTKFFGFKGPPFNPSPDPKFLYLSQSHREALVSMVYGIEQRRGFIAIMGEVGSGKTTLIHSLLSNLDNKTETAFIFYPSGTLSDLLRNILMEFDIDTEGKSKLELYLQFHNFVIDKFRKGGNVALIFDEAQNMSPEVLEQLRLLSNLESPQEKLFQIILAGQPELSNKLNRPELRQLRQRISIRREIEPLSDLEVRSYIEHRLKVAGYEGHHKLFSEKALDLICHYSKGIPRMVNILCDNSLLTAYGLNKRKIDESIIKEVLADLKIEQPIVEKIPAVEHPMADYPTIRPLKKGLQIGGILLCVLMLLTITIFLIQRDSRIGAHLSGFEEPTAKMGVLVSASKNKVRKNSQETTVIPGEEKPMKAKEQEPITQKSKKRIQITMVPPVEEGSSETVEKAPIEQKVQENTKEFSLILPAEKKEESLIQQLREGGVRLDSSHSWAVQVYSVRSLTCAKHLIDQLKHKGLPAYLIVGTLDRETWYGVRVGFYAMRKEALEIGMKIASEFHMEDYFAVQSPSEEIEARLGGFYGKDL
jgi:type II secretory pathway predicted ATPase ExeA